MSTRANIVVKDSTETHTMYRHCDGYIEGGLGEELKNWVQEYLKFNYTPNADMFCRWCQNNKDVEYDDVGIHGDVEFIYYVTLYKENINVSAEGCNWSKTSTGEWFETKEKLTNYTETF